MNIILEVKYHARRVFIKVITQISNDSLAIFFNAKPNLNFLTIFLGNLPKHCEILFCKHARVSYFKQQWK